jgi:hypothetical protein
MCAANVHPASADASAAASEMRPSTADASAAASEMRPSTADVRAAATEMRSAAPTEMRPAAASEMPAAAAAMASTSAASPGTRVSSAHQYSGQNSDGVDFDLRHGTLERPLRATYKCGLFEHSITRGQWQSSPPAWAEGFQPGLGNAVRSRAVGFPNLRLRIFSES